ncbi:MFS transporter [Ktedonobacteria bacterium brp13]|nr:MFS transporter [Ktedonobacteria bacterium brp13]
MYTFEDDHETTGRLRRAQLNAAEPTVVQQQAFAMPANEHMLPTDKLSKQVEPVAARKSDMPAPYSARAVLVAMIIACVGVFITALDQTVVVTALPQMITDLNIPLTQLDRAAWIISAYLLGFVIVMPLVGRVSDIYGRRRIFLLCLAIFGLGSLLCALAPQLGKSMPLTFLTPLHIDTSSPGLLWLIGARVIQAIGGGAVVPVAMAVASDVYPLHKRGLVLGIVGAVTEAGGAVGPLYGALIVGRLGWQYIFYFNVPLVLVLFAAACIGIPKGQRQYEKIDWWGALLLGLALTCLSLGLAQQGSSIGPVSASAQAGQSNPLTLILAGVFLVGFLLVERNVHWPIIDLKLFKQFAFSAAALTSLLVGAALIIAMTNIPIFVDTVLRLPVLDSGLALLRLTLMIPIGAIVGGWLCNRITSRITALLGLLCTATGFYLMSHWSIQPDWTQMTMGTVIAGLGFGLVIAPISTTAMNAVRLNQAGSSSAIITALRMVGMMLGLAMLTSWALADFRQLILTFPSSAAAASGDPLQNYARYALQAEHTVYTTVFFISAIICLLALIPALFLWGRKLPHSVLATLPLEEQPTAPIPDIHSRTGRVRPMFGTTNIILSGLLIVGSCSAVILAASLNANPAPKAPTREIQLALSTQALTSIFTTQLGKQQVIHNLQATPGTNNGLKITFSLHIDFGSIHRVMPIELDSTIRMDKQQNLQLVIQHVKRDGIEGTPAVAHGMQGALNQLMLQNIMPTIHQKLKSMQIIAVTTSQTISCGKNSTMLVFKVAISSLQGIPVDAIPSPICFHDALNLNGL